jgi:hypothetical protein
LSNSKTVFRNGDTGKRVSRNSAFKYLRTGNASGAELYANVTWSWKRVSGKRVRYVKRFEVSLGGE